MLKTIQTPVNVYDVAKLAFAKHIEEKSMQHYAAILTLHAQTRLAIITGDEDVLQDVRSHLQAYLRGDYTVHGKLRNYLCGGNATAYLYWQGKFPEAEAILREYAEDLMNNAARDDEGIFSEPNDPRNDKIWIDVAFAVTPFLLFTGLAFDEEAYIEEAYQQIAKMVRVLKNPDNGLLHQARSMNAPGKITEDHWSRGNGWGIYALAELVNYLPDDHPRRAESEKLFVDLVNACLEFQHTDGLWFQEIPDSKEDYYRRSYIETSGSGLILYAIGVGLEKGILPESVRENFKRGLHGYLDYIRDDGSVYHTCKGNRAPGDGSVIYFKAAPPVLNDIHAFGPVILAFGQAGQIGITTL